jgi:hypothetical protein
MNRNILRQAQELQAKMAKAQEELANATVEASAGGEAIKVVMDGQQNIQSIKISTEAIDMDDISLLEDLVMAAVNEAVKKSQELATQHLGALTGNLKIPGLM